MMYRRFLPKIPASGTVTLYKPELVIKLYVWLMLKLLYRRMNSLRLLHALVTTASDSSESVTSFRERTEQHLQVIEEMYVGV
jgi:hypothetical protein